LTRTHDKITRETIHDFIDTLDIKPGLKARLKQITPFNYTGV
jgi:adenylosuccinate lyase